MKWPWSAHILSQLVLGSLCLLLAAPAMAHPGSLWGIDMTSLVALRDQARIVGHTQSEPPSDDALPRLRKIRTIVIDPGHGGDNHGAIGVAGIPEKYLTLELAYQLRDQLQDKYPDLRVIMTRYWDTSIDYRERVHLANLAQADLFLSLHYNAAPHNRARGFETYFLSPQEVTPGQEQPQGQPLATTDPGVTGVAQPIPGVIPFGHSGATLTLIEQDLLRAHQHDLSGALAETVQDCFRSHLDSIDRGVKQANFAVLRGAHMPAILVEAGFLTHPEEGMEVLTAAHRQRLTQALIESVEAFDRQLVIRLGDGESGPESADETTDEPDGYFLLEEQDSATDPGGPIAKIDRRH